MSCKEAKAEWNEESDFFFFGQTREKNIYFHQIKEEMILPKDLGQYILHIYSNIYFVLVFLCFIFIFLQLKKFYSFFFSLLLHLNQVDIIKNMVSLIVRSFFSGGKKKRSFQFHYLFLFLFFPFLFLILSFSHFSFHFPISSVFQVDSSFLCLRAKKETDQELLVEK